MMHGMRKTCDASFKAKKKRQHYVWRHYLRAWAKNDSIYCLSEGKVFEVNLMNVACMRYFYKAERLRPEELAFIRELINKQVEDHLKEVNKGWLETFSGLFQAVDEIQMRSLDKEVTSILIEKLIVNFEEDLHSLVETDAVAYIKALQKGDVSFIHDQQNAVKFYHFIALQYLRTRKQQEAVIASAKGSLPNNIRMSAIWKILRHVFASSIGWTLFTQKADRRMVLLEPDAEEAFFITGDQPVVNTYATCLPKGTLPEELEFYYPVSPRLALLMTRRRDINSRVRVSEKVVDEYNEHILLNAYAQTYAHASEVLDRVHTQYIIRQRVGPS